MPATPMDHPPPAAESGASEVEAPEARTLLVVDDQEAIIASIVELFDGRYRVLGARHVAEALNLLQQGGIAVVMADQRMPGTSGSELLAQVARLDPEVTRILMTAYPDIDAVMQAINQGKIYYYIPKPWDSTELEAIIDKAFEYHDLVRERRRLIDSLQEANDVLEAKVQARTQELQEKNAALEAMNTLKNEFLGMAAHDLRSPIGNIHSLAELLLDQEPNLRPEERIEVASMIRKLAQGMMYLLNDLLDISTIESGKIELQLSPVAIPPFLAEIQQYHQRLAERKKIQVSTHILGNPPVLCFDQERIRQVLNNLLSNAIKFSPMHTLVQLTVCPTPMGIEFAVSDQGQGIRPEEQGKLFGAFQRTSTKPTAGESSTGLGLSICKKIVELHGGTIGVDSAVGRGSRFFFVLPMIEPSHQRPLMPPPPPSPGGGGGRG
jgi:signal transduction histidine kinase